MAKTDDAKVKMFEHSKAKVELYGNYLSIYLNVLERVPFVTKIFIYDLFGGEGEYGNGEYGSPIETIRCIKNHYFSNGEKCKDIQILINDSEYSEIELGKLKIDRIKEISDSIFKPQNVNIIFKKMDYADLLTIVNQEMNSLGNNERALIFIDPWGYKEIKPNELKALFINKGVEIILFLPISFMYRFSEKALYDDNYPEGKALESFLRELFSNDIPDITNPHQFIMDLKNRFKTYMTSKYVDSFSIQRDRTNLYSLFFFIHSKTGFHKMVEAKWRVDKESGKGFRLSKNLSLFSEVELDDYETKLKHYIFDSNGKTNEEIHDFGYEYGFLPKHSGIVLKKISNEIELTSLDGKEVKGYYLSDSNRKILVKKKEI